MQKMSPTGHLIICSGLLAGLTQSLKCKSPKTVKPCRFQLWFFTSEIKGSDDNSDSNNNNNSSNSHLFGLNYMAGNMLGVLYKTIMLIYR